jgi:hypothetical protein
MEEGKIVSYKIEGSNLVVSVDPNKDGTPVIEIKLNALEVFNEIGSALGTK